MNDWYRRQFGQRDRIAVAVAFGQSPFPPTDPEVDSTWGGFQLWVRGRCLTRSVVDETSSDEIRWTLLPLLEWLARAAVRLVNEEPLPLVLPHAAARDTLAWLDETEEPPPRLDGAAESAWFEARSDWAEHHALARAALDAALPHVLLRRLGDIVEVTWDNEGWRPPHPAVRFVEPRGRELVGAHELARVLMEAIRDGASALHQRFGSPRLAALVERARTFGIAGDDWHWLVPPTTAELIRAHRGALASHLEAHTRRDRDEIFVPHTLETLLLRQAEVTTPAELETVLALGERLRSTELPPFSDLIGRLIDPAPAPTHQPFREGYERALEVRSTLGWGIEPVPELEGWMSEQAIVVAAPDLAGAVDLVAARLDRRALAAVNPRSPRAVRRETAWATALGHILMDEDPVAVDGSREDWPRAARARAFGIMLQLPREAVQRELGQAPVDATFVQHLAVKYRTGLDATTYHLQNLRLISDDERHALLTTLAA